jgi:hypothetical protein
MESKYKIIEVIGTGNQATTYKIQIGKKYYALRREKIFKSEAIKLKEIFKNKNTLENTDNHFYRQIYFNNFINTINKNHFITLYKYKINKCNFTQNLLDFTKNNPNLLKRYNDLLKSKYCIDIIMDLKDGIIYDILSKLSSNQIYSLIIQCIYALHLMHSNGFYHTDINESNIMYKKTTLKTIKIFGLKIPTFGYLYSIIDYEEVISTKFKLSDNEILNMSSRNYKYEDNMKILCRCIFYGSEDRLNIINKIISNDKTLFNDDWFNNHFDNQSLLKYEHIKYYILNVNDPHKLINYFYKLIKSN